MPDETVLICAPWRADTPTTSIAGSVRCHCDDCERAIAVAPSGMAMVTPETTLVCLDCGQKRISDDPEPKLMPPTSEQVAEILGHRRRS